MDTLEIAKAVSALPLTVLLVLVLIGGYVEWWIYGSIHRAQLSELNAQLALERSRSDRWEARFLEVGDKVEATLAKATEIGHAVNGTSQLAVEKLERLEAQIAVLHAEVARVQELRVQESRKS